MSDQAHKIDWEFLDRTAAIGEGDLVSAAAGGLPIYRVICQARPPLREITR